MTTTNVFNELKWRDLIYDCTEGVQDLLTNEKVIVYNGFDVTADSLTVGHIVPLISMARLQRFGHHPILVAGAGTTMIGDPSGKSSERQLMPYHVIEANADAIKKQLAHFLDFEVAGNPARMVNNADWLTKLNLIEFMRDIGKYFSVNYMLTKDSVRTRLEREEGLSFTEFTYMLMQSYDFFYLYDHFGCRLQTGGSDQWGNITAGTELIRRLRGITTYGMVYPLLLNADGTKFGKSEAGAVWLSAERTSPYRFYQYWLNTGDHDVISRLKIFTFLNEEKINELAQAVKDHPEQREAQLALARLMTSLVHGQTALERAEQASQALFGGDITGLTGDEISDIFADVPSCELAKQQFEGKGMQVIDLLVSTGMCQSKGEARRAIQEGGIYLNNDRVVDTNDLVELNRVLAEEFIILRRGRKNYNLVRIF
jgi:tyrosyl-tRNA synthetase